MKLDRIFESIDSQERSIKRNNRDIELGLKSKSPSQERRESEMERIERSALYYYTRLDNTIIPTKRRF